MTQISIVMIAKNEATVISRALAGWKALGDQLIVVDTGSTDNTVRLARDLGAIVLSYDWQYPGNKGSARNMGIDAATGDWIVMLDADEVITERAALRRAILSLDETYNAVSTIFENITDAGAVTLRWRQIRIFRRGSHRYKHREHEMPCPVTETVEIGADIVFEHRPPADRGPAKMQPMIDRLELDVIEHPGDPHPLYFLHRQYLLDGQHQKAIDYGQQYLVSPGEHDRCECLGNMALAYEGLGDATAAIAWLHNALANQPWRRVWWLRLAEIYFNHNMAHFALPFLLGARAIPPVHGEQHEQPGINDQSITEFIHLCEHATGAAHSH